VSYDEKWPADGHARRIDVLTHTLRDLAAQVRFPDPQIWDRDEGDLDPLSPEGLAAQTGRLLKLIERARDHNDASLLHSLRRELLLTRWALVKSRSAHSRGAAEKRAVPRAQDRTHSDHRARFQHLGRRAEVSPTSGAHAATPTPPSPEPGPRG
jgi:hypothetical protein